jgi:hypothetical protein
MERLNWKAALVELPLGKLVKAKWNYKYDDEAKRAKLSANLKRNGQVENLVVRTADRGRFEVIIGNHRLDAMRDAGFQTAYCFNVGKVSQAAAVRLAIELNETRFDTNQLVLAERIREIAGEFTQEDLVATLPYSEKEFEEMRKLLDFNWEQYNKEPGQRDAAEAAADFVPIAAFFSKLGITGIPKDLAEKLQPMIEQVIDRQELTPANAFMVFDVLYAALAEEAEAVGETVQTAHKKK